MACTYTIYDKNGTYKTLTYRQLVDSFIEGDYRDVSDVLYSRNAKTQAIVDKISNDTHEFIVKSSKQKDNYSPDYTDGRLTTQLFVDDPRFQLHGKRLMMPKSDADYIANVKQQYMSEGMTEQESENKAKQDILKWDIIDKDSITMHQALNSSKFRDGQRSDFIESLQGTKFERHAHNLFDSVQDFRAFACGRYKMTDEKSAILQSINLIAKLSGTDTDILGHIDNLIIDSSGNLHIYNYKVTSHPIKNMFKGEKGEKYYYQMALLKQILAHNSYNVTNCTLHIVPIRLVYNDDYSEVQNVIFDKKDIVDLASGRAFSKYDTIAKHFIESFAIINPVKSKSIDNINRALQHIFPLRAIHYEGIRQSVDEWIKKNYSVRIESRIKKVDSPDYAYELYLENDLNKVIKIKDPNPDPLKNAEIRKHVETHLKENITQEQLYIRKLLDAIRVGHHKGIPQVSNIHTKNEKTRQSYKKIDQAVSKYVKSRHAAGLDTYEPDWKLISDDKLLDANILVFQHYRSGLIDVVVLSDFDLRAKLPTEKNRTHIMGFFASNTSPDAAGLLQYGQTFANIEAVRTMVVLNELLPEITQQDPKLGELRIISSEDTGDSLIFSFERLNRELFQGVLRIVKKNDKDFKYTNNFVHATYSDPVDILIDDYKSLMDSDLLSDAEKQEIQELGVGNFENMQTREQKRVMLRNIINNIFELDPDLKIASPEEILEMSSRNKLARLYIQALKAYCYYSGITVNREGKISNFYEYVMTPNRNPNDTYRGVTLKFIQAVDKVAGKVLDEYYHIHRFTMQFYRNSGFGDGRNSIVGDNSKAFRNLFRINSKGIRLMEFRDPYIIDAQPTLLDAEKLYLKQVIYEFTKIRSRIYGFEFNFNRFDLDNKEYIAFLHKNKNWIFNVPLEKASPATVRDLAFKDRWLKRKDTISRMIHHPRELFKEIIDDASMTEGREKDETPFDAIPLENKYIHTDGYNGHDDVRNEYINSKGDNYFETNIENILAHYLEKEMQVNEFNKTLIDVKGTLLMLAIVGDAAGNDKKNGIQQTTKMIQDFIKQNMFNKSLLSPEEEAVMGWIMPFKKLVTEAYIAGNIKSMFRDTFEGIFQNYSRVLTKYGTEASLEDADGNKIHITAKNVTKAYKEVLKSSVTSARTVTKMDQLCKMYRLSNLDVIRISEGLTTSKSGIKNIESWMYATMKAPDFLNRMVLFTARCLLDGSWDAFKMNDKGELEYDWRLDERFKAYADDSKKGTQEWLDARTRYFNAIRQYNKENPDQAIEYNDTKGLPVAYSNQEIQQIRHLANSIYGAYDKHMRAKYERTMLGLTFTMFSTWMNGQISNWIAKPGEYADGITRLRHKVDGSGNKQFMDGNMRTVTQIIDGDNITYIYEDTGETCTTKDLVPIYENVPLVVQGIIWTYRDAFLTLSRGGWDEFKDEIWNNSINRANIKKSLCDLLVTLLISVLFREYVLDPEYKEFKKGMGDRPVVMNALGELTYGGLSNSWDGFNPLSPVIYFGNNTNPPVYKFQTKVLGDLGSTVFGDKTWLQFTTGNVALLRSLKQTIGAAEKNAVLSSTPTS